MSALVLPTIDGTRYWVPYVRRFKLGGNGRLESHVTTSHSGSLPGAVYRVSNDPQHLVMAYCTDDGMLSFCVEDALPAGSVPFETPSFDSQQEPYRLDAELQFLELATLHSEPHEIDTYSPRRPRLLPYLATENTVIQVKLSGVNFTVDADFAGVVDKIGAIEW